MQNQKMLQMLHGIRGNTPRAGFGRRCKQPKLFFYYDVLFLSKDTAWVRAEPCRRGGWRSRLATVSPLSLQCDEAPLPQRAQRGGHLVGRRVECLGDVGHLRAVGQLERRKLELVAQLDPRLLTAARCERSRRPHGRPWSGARAPPAARRA